GLELAPSRVVTPASVGAISRSRKPALVTTHDLARQGGAINAGCRGAVVGPQGRHHFFPAWRRLPNQGRQSAADGQGQEDRGSNQSVHWGFPLHLSSKRKDEGIVHGPGRGGDRRLAVWLTWQGTALCRATSGS